MEHHYIVQQLFLYFLILKKKNLKLYTYENCLAQPFKIIKMLQPPTNNVL